ncbi:unnamed protein product [Mycena citricolor]|uniref:Cytochrome b5 heme-binding domain-containing protein n=1 Tax=Mycena citricolor TaxID=2018698 RepID=A0AAD2H7F2_9AGAR|nr:unnamed protein product [Mycena citricolor]
MALAGIKVIEFAGLAPGPFAGLVLADNGASVIRIDRPSASSSDILCRGKRSLAINPKSAAGKATLRRLIASADVLIDPYRPGVMERLGLGPEDGRVRFSLAGWSFARLNGAKIPKSRTTQNMAGHDINYLALSGVLSMLPGSNEKPTFPLNLLADFGGGGLTCAVGILLALFQRVNSGRGQVVDADMVSGVRYLSSFPLLGLLTPTSPFHGGERGSRLLDGGAPFYDVYTCKDGRWMSVGCLEPAFFKTFLGRFKKALPRDFRVEGWAPESESVQFDTDQWPKLRQYFAEGFKVHDRDYWTAVFHGKLSVMDPTSPFPVPHPRISDLEHAPQRNSRSLHLPAGLHTMEILRELGVQDSEIDAMVTAGHASVTILSSHRCSAAMSKQFTLEEVAKHNKAGDVWVVIDAKVYDLSKFSNMHPGGLAVLLDPEVAGQDATEAFYGLHRAEVLVKPQYQRLQIGTIVGQQSLIQTPTPGLISKVPYAEPSWLVEGYHSPYYTENHRQFQLAMRKFVDEFVTPEAEVKEENGTRVSQELLDRMAALNIHAMRLGPGKHLKGLTLMNGLVEPEKFDYFHELIAIQELTRCGNRGYGDGLLSGMVIGLPPVLNFGSEEVKAKVVPEVLQGKKFISLAISEAHAGSDVMGLQTTAVKSEDGKEWIINGTKKWITNGTFSDYFTVGCKTEDGFTVILVERGPGVETKPIKTSYSAAAGTAFITFDNARAPVGNTLGEEGGGIFVMLSNFNHERWVMCCNSARAQRGMVEECLKWTNQRKAFGKPLNSLAIIRSKLAAMISRAESCQTWLESISYQMCNMSYKQQASKLAGPIAFLKAYSTSCGQETAADAVQIFGGRGITRTGMGRYVEHYHRTIAFDALLGGAEDVLRDLGVRQAMRAMPADAKL